MGYVDEDHFFGKVFGAVSVLELHRWGSVYLIFSFDSEISLE
jgi:hypothetical protein